VAAVAGVPAIDGMTLAFPGRACDTAAPGRMLDALARTSTMRCARRGRAWRAGSVATRRSCWRTARSTRRNRLAVGDRLSTHTRAAAKPGAMIHDGLLEAASVPGAHDAWPGAGSRVRRSACRPDRRFRRCRARGRATGGGTMTTVATAARPIFVGGTWQISDERLEVPNPGPSRRAGGSHVSGQRRAARRSDRGRGGRLRRDPTVAGLRARRPAAPDKRRRPGAAR
jgi:hypothetical protein